MPARVVSKQGIPINVCNNPAKEKLLTVHQNIKANLEIAQPYRDFGKTKISYKRAMALNEVFKI